MGQRAVRTAHGRTSDVEADTGFVVDTMVFALCEVTIDYENGQSEMASKYVAAATIFNFLWQAYEAAVSRTAPDELRRLAKEWRSGSAGAACSKRGQA